MSGPVWMYRLPVVGLFAPLLARTPWALPGIVLLGVLTSIAEGIGLSLFAPFLQSLGNGPQASDNWLLNRIGGLFGGYPPDTRLRIIALAILAAIVLSALLGYANRLLFFWLDARVAHESRTALFDGYLGATYAFFEDNDRGDLINAIGQETWRTSKALSMLVNLIVAACTLFIYAVLLLLLSWRLTLLVGAVMWTISRVVRWLTGRAAEIGRAETETNSVLMERIIEGVEGMQVIRAFGREEHESDRFRAASSRVSAANLRIGRLVAAVAPTYEILAATLLVAIMLHMLGAPSELPVLLVFLLILYRMQPRIQALDAARVTLEGLKGAVEKVTRLLEVTADARMPPGFRTYQALVEGIRFDNVSFRYQSVDRPAVADVAIEIPAGAMTALVGPSGAGKSTIVKLVLRLYDPTAGQVLVDGVPLPELDVASWRSRIAFVSQDVYVFNTTVRENIAYGRLDAAESEIVEAARQADAHEFILNLPRGYDTLIGDRGVRISGGQRQRLSLARALVRLPDLLILDEATNALDSLSEQAIAEALESLGAKTAILVVAHRISTIERADRIIVLDRGRVVEQGGYGDLLTADGLFARMRALQTGPTTR